jgi:hypothetical protein
MDNSISINANNNITNSIVTETNFCQLPTSNNFSGSKPVNMISSSHSVDSLSTVAPSFKFGLSTKMFDTKTSRNESDSNEPKKSESSFFSLLNKTHNTNEAKIPDSSSISIFKPFSDTAATTNFFTAVTTNEAIKTSNQKTPSYFGIQSSIFEGVSKTAGGVFSGSTPFSNGENLPASKNGLFGSAGTIGSIHFGNDGGEAEADEGEIFK